MSTAFGNDIAGLPINLYRLLVVVGPYTLKVIYDLYAGVILDNVANA